MIIPAKPHSMELDIVMPQDIVCCGCHQPLFFSPSTSAFSALFYGFELWGDHTPESLAPTSLPNAGSLLDLFFLFNQSKFFLTCLFHLEEVGF